MKTPPKLGDKKWILVLLSCNATSTTLSLDNIV